MLQGNNWSCFRKGEFHILHGIRLFCSGIFSFLFFFATTWHTVHFSNQDVYATAKVLIFQQITTEEMRANVKIIHRKKGVSDGAIWSERDILTTVVDVYLKKSFCSSACNST